MMRALFPRLPLAAGASGYVMKDVMSDTVVEAVRTVLRGDIVVSKQIFRDGNELLRYAVTWLDRSTRE